MAEISAIHWLFTRVHASWAGEISVQFPQGQGLLSPKYTDRSEKNGTLGGVLTVHCGRGSGYYHACELSSQDFGTCHHPQLLHYLSGLYPCNPGTKCPLLHPKHLSLTRFAGWASHEDIWMSSTGHEKLHRAQVAVLHHGDSHPAPIYRSAALSVSRSNDTHTNTVIPSWALMWLEVMAGNKSLLLVPGWIACRWVNPIANPNNMTSSLLQKQFLCNVPYSNGSASSRSE